MVIGVIIGLLIAAAIAGFGFGCYYFNKKRNKKAFNLCGILCGVLAVTFFIIPKFSLSNLQNLYIKLSAEIPLFSQYFNTSLRSGTRLSHILITCYQL